MFSAVYNRLPASEKAQKHWKRCSPRLRRQALGSSRRKAFVPLVLVLVLIASLIRVNPWSRLPPAPPTPFVLSNSPSTRGNITEESMRSEFSNALSAIARLKAPKFRPRCTEPRALRYSSISASHTNFTIFLALNLHNSQWVLPTFIQELPVLLSFMGPTRFHVSIMENGSSDSSASLLVTLARALAALGTSYDIVVKGERVPSNKRNNRRIVELANIRNAAMDPLYTGKAARAMGIDRFDTVLFMNDIIWCTNDILEILYEHKIQEAHMTCATDWGSNVIYDRWIARAMSGLPLYSQDTLIQYFNGPKTFFPSIPRPFPYDHRERTLFESLKPFQVFSCWNGAAVIDAQAFSPMPGSDSRGLPSEGDFIPGIRFRTALNDVTSITEKASECFLLPVDLWKRGLGKIMLVPKASVAYELPQYAHVRQDGGRTRKHPIGIEQPVLSSIDRSARSWRLPFSSWRQDANSNVLSEDDAGLTKIRWRLTPPERVLYHDYAMWYAKERWGPWDEA